MSKGKRVLQKDSELSRGLMHVDLTLLSAFTTFTELGVGWGRETLELSTAFFLASSDARPRPIH